MSLAPLEISWLTSRPSFTGRRGRVILASDVEPVKPGAFQDLPTKPPSGEVGAIIYCGYVRALITATGLALALGIRRGTAADYLGALARLGYLRPTASRSGGRGRNRLGRYARVWEWVG